MPRCGSPTTLMLSRAADGESGREVIFLRWTTPYRSWSGGVRATADDQQAGFAVRRRRSPQVSVFRTGG